MDSINHGKSRPKLNKDQSAFVDLKSGSLSSMRYSRAYVKNKKKKSSQRNEFEPQPKKAYFLQKKTFVDEDGREILEDIASQGSENREGDQVKI